MLAAARNEGDMTAANILLDCLVVYKGWYDCLLQVLQHEDVKMSHLVNKFEDIRGKLTTNQIESINNKITK